MAYEPWVLIRGETRVELYCVATDDARADEGPLFSLLTYAGPEAGEPCRRKGQGPFHQRAYAEYVLGGIARALKAQGFTPAPRAPARWPLQAAADARAIRESRGRHRGDYRFRPEHPPGSL